MLINNYILEWSCMLYYALLYLYFSFFTFFCCICFPVNLFKVSFQTACQWALCFSGSLPVVLIHLFVTFYLKNKYNEPNWSQNSKTENSVPAVWFSKTDFKNRLWQFGKCFSHCLIHKSSSNMIGSTVKVFFFKPYLCTSGSESLWLTISWTNSAQKYIISSIIPLRHKWKMLCKKIELKKTETAVNVVNRNQTKPSNELNTISNLS